MLHCGTNIKSDDGDERGDQQLDDLSMTNKLVVPTQTGSIKGKEQIHTVVSNTFSHHVEIIAIHFLESS